MNAFVGRRDVGERAPHGGASFRRASAKQHQRRKRPRRDLFVGKRAFARANDERAAGRIDRFLATERQRVGHRHDGLAAAVEIAFDDGALGRRLLVRRQHRCAAEISRPPDVAAEQHAAHDSARARLEAQEQLGPSIGARLVDGHGREIVQRSDEQRRRRPIGSGEDRPAQGRHEALDDGQTRLPREREEHRGELVDGQGTFLRDERLVPSGRERPRLGIVAHDQAEELSSTFLRREDLQREERAERGAIADERAVLVRRARQRRPREGRR